MKRRPVSPFSLSFLDIMFCGFGAVVLLVLILNTDTVRARNQTFADLRAEVVRLEQEIITGQEDLATARNSLEATTQELASTRGESEQVIEEIRTLETGIARMERETLASRTHINQLSSDLKDLDSEKKRLGAETVTERDEGDKLRRFAGEGDRQYLTGLKVGGKNILILMDVSASMLDETIINIIRRRNMGTSGTINASKWKRGVATVEWLLSNLPGAARFQLYTFNTTARPAIAGSEGRWLPASAVKDMDGAVQVLKKTVPGGGTSLYHAFAVARTLSPKPDNILLVTDGLPTQGRDRPSSTTVSAKERLAHFDKARKNLPAGIPVNTILLPMEGDAYAAAAFWKLAIDTDGSFLTPARDWP